METDGSPFSIRWRVTRERPAASAVAVAVTFNSLRCRRICCPRRVSLLSVLQYQFWVILLAYVSHFIHSLILSIMRNINFRILVVRPEPWIPPVLRCNGTGVPAWLVHGLWQQPRHAVRNQQQGLVFMLWGSYAQKKGAVIDRRKHLVLKASHPSPLSAHRVFLGCKHFSQANDYLQQQQQAPIDWSVPG